MLICGQMYSTYVQLKKWPEGYRSNLKVTPVTRISEEEVETNLKGSPNLLIESVRLRKPRGFLPIYK